MGHRNAVAPLSLRIDELTERQAWATAQFCKRLTFADVRERATSDDEAYLMLEGINAVAAALREQGFSPR